MLWQAVTLYPALLDIERRQHGQHGSHCRNWQMHYWCWQIDQRRSQMMQWTLLRGLSYLCLTEPAPAPRWTMPEESSFHGKQWIPPTQAALVEHVKRAVYQGGHMWGKTLLPDPVLPSPTDWGWVKTEGMYEPTGQRCHKHQNPATSWSLVAARVVAESAAGARRLHFSAQASASVRENVPADSKISHLLKH